MPLGASEPPIWLGHAPGPWADLGAFTFFSIRVIIRMGLVSSSLVADIEILQFTMSIFIQSLPVMQLALSCCQVMIVLKDHTVYLKRC